MRMNAGHRRRIIVEAATTLAKQIGLKRLTFANVADQCPVNTSSATVKRYMGNRVDLWTEAARDCPELADQARELGVADD